MVTITKSEVRMMARRWAQIKDAEDQLNERRKALGEKLLAAMIRTRQTQIPLTDGRSVVHVLDKGSKNPTKGTLVALLGEDRAEEVWAKCPQKPYEYLSIAEGKG